MAKVIAVFFPVFVIPPATQRKMCQLARANGVDEDLESPMNQLLGSSITYRIAVGLQQGRFVCGLADHIGQGVPVSRSTWMCGSEIIARPGATHGQVNRSLSGLTVATAAKP